MHKIEIMRGMVNDTLESLIEEKFKWKFNWGRSVSKLNFKPQEEASMEYCAPGRAFSVGQVKWIHRAGILIVLLQSIRVSIWNFEIWNLKICFCLAHKVMSFIVAFL